MKEATGELNMTVVTVVAIAAVGAFFYAIVWPTIQTSIKQSTYCATAYNCSQEGGVNKCTYRNESGDEASIECQINDQSNDVAGSGSGS
ncbi:MAG: hypothetical protein R3Y13_04150 [bacterium]